MRWNRSSVTSRPIGERGLHPGRTSARTERAPDDVLPEPALGLVHGRRHPSAERRPVERRADAELVEAVPALVHRAEERDQPSRRTAWSDGCRRARRSRRGGRSGRGGRRPRSRRTARSSSRESASCSSTGYGPGGSSSSPAASCSATSARELGLERVEHLPHLVPCAVPPRTRRARRRTVVVGREVLTERRLSSIIRSSQGRKSGKVVVSRAFTHAWYDSTWTFASSAASSDGTRRLLLPLPPRDADEARVVGVGGKRRGVRSRLVEQLADPVCAPALVDDRLQRRELVGAGALAAREASRPPCPTPGRSLTRSRSGDLREDALQLRKAPPQACSSNSTCARRSGARSRRTRLHPAVRDGDERVLVRLVEVRAARLAAPVGAGPSEPGDRGEHERLPASAVEDLELAPLGDRGLVDVPGEDELGAGVCERLEHAIAVLDGLFPPGRPRGRREVVVQRDDAERARPRLAEARGDRCELLVVERAALLAPRPHGVQPDDDERLRGGHAGSVAPNARSHSANVDV